MQPPPPAGPSGMGGPPRMGMTTNAYWRKRTPTPSAMAAPLVQPVTDPFAFGRMTPQSMAPGNAPKSNMLTMSSPSPSLYPQPGPPSAAADQSLAGAQACIPSSTSQPGAGAAMHSSASPPLLPSGHFSNSMAPAPTMQLGFAHSAPTSLHNITGGLENASVPSQGRSQSRQSVVTEGGNGSHVSAPLQSYPPSSSQQITAPWGSTQVAPPTSSQNFPPTAQHAAYNTPYYSPPYLEVSHLPPQSSDQTYFSAPHRTAPASFPLTGGSNHVQQQSASQFNNTIPVDYMQNQNIEQNSRFGQAYQEPQQNPPLPSSTTLPPGAPLPVPENKPQSESTKIIGSEVNSGTVSTFFKGDEAENVEILSTEQLNASNQASNISYQPIGHSAILSLSQTQPAVSNTQTITSSPFHPPVTYTPSLVSENSSSFQDPHVLWKVDNVDNQHTEAKGGSEQLYDNVENIECVQNLEVLPNEPQNNIFPTGLNSEGLRYGSLPAPALPKNIPSHIEGGPNLEAPGGMSRSVRSDSVSSNYSNLSHRSLPISTRPQELIGTFIQKESGKLENESTNSFFKQIDSSPLGKDSNVQAVGQKTFHGNLSQPPTPSPPKPTGIFQASVNSSFEPVRSYIGVKPIDIDQSKIVGEVRDANKHIPNPSNNATSAVSPGNLEQPPDNLETIFTGSANAEVLNVTSGNVFGVPPFDSLLLDKRPSSRAHGSNKKCESPATTLWAQGELPNFGGNVLLAPPAPAVYVPPKPQNEVIQPPEEGAMATQNSRLDPAQFVTMPEEHTSSENLENPPKIGDDEHPPSQASSGYASLLSSPPTDSLQNQPVLIAQPSKNYNLAQPINFSLSLPNQNKNLNSVKDPSAADRPAHTGNYIPAQNASLALGQPGPPLKMPNSLKNNFPPGSDRFSEMFSSLPQNVKPSSSNQFPLNLVTEGLKNGKAESVAVESIKSSVPVSGSYAPVGNATGTVAVSGSLVGSQMENIGAVDFTVPRASTNQNANAHSLIQNQPSIGVPNYPNQSSNVPNFQPGPDINKQGFYQQVTKVVQQQPSFETLQPRPGPFHEYMTPVSQAPPGAPPGQVVSGSKPVTYPPQPAPPVPTGQNLADLRYTGTSEPGPKYESSEQKPYPPHPVSTSAAPANPSQSVGYPEQARPPSQTPQQVDPYYYYRGYGAYPSAYPQPYPPMDPRASHLYYQDILLQDSYGTYDPAYRQYSNNGFVNPGKYPYQEPERPSSRSSHCSDRPSSRQGYNAPANYYADYYQTQYDYGDHSRWDRYPETYDPGYRDPRSSYWNFVYAAREDPYRKVPHGYTSRYDVYEDRWQYDPRYVGGFDDEIDARRDLAKDDFDRRSIHSEHSARSVHSEQSVHSRRSSFSSRSQQSQIYKSDQDLTTNVYSNHPANTAHGDYSYSMYPNEYSTQQPLDSSQYVYSSGSEWQPVEQVPSRPLTPEKFGNPHVCARFGPGGHLIKVLPNLPSDGQPTLVEIHNMEIILQSCPEQEQMRAFPGPLVKDETHKVDVINFAQNKAKECTQNENLMDQESARLLWDFIVLLCRQNGTVVGTDIAELLLQDHKTVWLPGKSPNEANLIDFSNEPLEQEEESVASQLSFLTDTLPISGAIMEKETERFREMLLYGRKKDALESAMKHGLWGHALLLASKMDSRTHARVMTRFANSLPINDPLQTVYQLLSGRMPAAATCCGDEKWGDWRPHLAMVLSNITNNLDVPTRTMTTMGDTLASRGLLDAAHFCYIMAQAGFGVYTKKTTKLVLIGSNHSLPFAKFATNEAIQRTEAYEYAQSLGAQTISLPNIQVYKFIYACRLAEHGLSAQAFQYCELIAKTILKHPSYYSPVLVSQLLEVSLHLRFFDPQLKEKPEQELFVEPSWLVRLRHLDMQMKQGTVVYNTGRTTPQQYACSTPSSEQDHISQSDGMPVAHEGLHNTDNPLLANLLPNMIPPVQGVQLALPGPEHTSTYQPPPVSEPSYPVTQQTFVPSPGFSPPVSGPGFGAFSSDPVPTYTPATMEPAPTPPQPTEFTPQEQWNQEPTVQRLPQSSPTKTTFHDPGFDFYGEMAKMAPGQRSRTVSQSSSHMRRTRTTSESSTHSIGSTRRSSIGIQPSPPPPAIPETERSEAKKEPKASYPSQGGSRSWFPLKIGWLMGKGKNEAHLPDDRNKSIVWDENKQRWVNLDEPEGEESKPLPPPPSVMPKRPQSGPGGPGAPPNPSVNMFSIRAGGARGRYVDVLNPGGSKPASTVPPPADLFAPLAPMPIPSNLFVPNSVPEEGQPSLGSDAETVQPPDQPGLGNPTQTQFLSTTSGADLPPSNSEDYPSGELSRSSSLSSLSREVSQHMNQDFSNAAPTSGPPAGTVAFYNPLSFTQQTPAGGSAARPGRLGQRKYPALK
ncbi:protein transport protein Sec16A isoform X1 [Aquarana catesbeiana]|uniref:protein transport protein Sec16A isoform X1 n=1 Tax=Aquarana catesbeiana TaxID=8400 RepID=UPI003CCA34C9